MSTLEMKSLKSREKCTQHEKEMLPTTEVAMTPDRTCTNMEMMVFTFKAHLEGTFVPN